MLQLVQTQVDVMQSATPQEVRYSRRIILNPCKKSKRKVQCPDSYIGAVSYTHLTLPTIYSV